MPNRKNDYEPYTVLPYNRRQRITDGNAFTICMESDERLLDENYYLVSWHAVKNYISYHEKTILGGKEMPRYMVLDIITDAFRDHVRRSGIILDQHGMPISLPDPIDNIFDPTLHWFSEYLRADKSGLKPRNHKKIVERLRWLDVAMKIRYLEYAPFSLGKNKENH